MQHAPADVAVCRADEGQEREGGDGALQGERDRGVRHVQHQVVTVEAGRADALSEGDARQHAARGVVHQAEEREGRLRAAARRGRHVRRAAVLGARRGRELLAVGLC